MTLKNKSKYDELIIDKCKSNVLEISSDFNVKIENNTAIISSKYEGFNDKSWLHSLSPYRIPFILNSDVENIEYVTYNPLELNSLLDLKNRNDIYIFDENGNEIYINNYKNEISLELKLKKGINKFYGYYGSGIKNDKIKYLGESDPLYYHKETDNNIINIKIPSLKAGETKTIYISENSEYSSFNNPEKTYIFYDDFEGESLDLNKWDTSDDAFDYTISDSKLNITNIKTNSGDIGNHGIFHQINEINNIECEIKGLKWNSTKLELGGCFLTLKNDIKVGFCDYWAEQYGMHDMYIDTDRWYTDYNSLSESDIVDYKITVNNNNLINCYVNHNDYTYETPKLSKNKQLSDVNVGISVYRFNNNKSSFSIDKIITKKYYENVSIYPNLKNNNLEIIIKNNNDFDLNNYNLKIDISELNPTSNNLKIIENTNSNLYYDKNETNLTIKIPYVKANSSNSYYMTEKEGFEEYNNPYKVYVQYEDFSKNDLLSKYDISIKESIYMGYTLDTTNKFLKIYHKGGRHSGGVSLVSKKLLQPDQYLIKTYTMRDRTYGGGETNQYIGLSDNSLLSTFAIVENSFSAAMPDTSNYYDDAYCMAYIENYNDRREPLYNVPHLKNDSAITNKYITLGIIADLLNQKSKVYLNLDNIVYESPYYNTNIQLSNYRLMFGAGGYNAYNVLLNHYFYNVSVQKYYESVEYSLNEDNKLVVFNNNDFDLIDYQIDVDLTSSNITSDSLYISELQHIDKIDINVIIFNRELRG